MKKTLITLIALIIAFSSSVFADTLDIVEIRPVGEVSESGYQEYGMFDSDGNQIQPVERTPKIMLFASRLPEKYDSRDYGYISPVRNQGAFGTCWAHAFVACAEANMIKKGYEQNFNNYSELHLAYFYHKRNEAQGDGVDVFDSDPQTQHGYFGGGNGIYAAQFAENFQALAVESDFPYSMASGSKDFSIDEKYRNHADVHMVNYGKLYSAEDAKKAIMRYGAISLDFAIYDNYLSDQFAYYQNVYTDTNHEVAVVGWDDSFSIENFNPTCRPKTPGAWLVKNSYGKTYGDLGYFWLSYEDPSIKLGCFYEFEPVGDENKVHTYNGGLANIQVNFPSVANVFKAEEDQTLYAVGFESKTTEIFPERYEIKIYVANSKPESPTDGNHAVTLSGDIAFDGFHHIELPTPITLKNGQYFSVIVTQKSKNGEIAFSAFEAGDNFTSHEGETYYLNGDWKDAYNSLIVGPPLKNSTIKAYYKTNTATVTFNTREAEHFDTQTVNIGECIARPEDPVKEGFEFLGWYTNNTVTEEWDFSTPITHDMVLFAKWTEPENVDMKIVSEYFVPSYPPFVNISANNITGFRFYFLKDNKMFAPSELFTPDNANKDIPYRSLPLGNYQIFADVTGINGEEITSDVKTFTFTDKTALSVHGGYIYMLNIPPAGADLYVAQYDNEGRFLNIKKTSHYRSYDDKGNTILNKIINAPTNYTNPQFFLWSADGITPLCEKD